MHHGDVGHDPLLGEFDLAEQMLATGKARRQGGLATLLEHQEILLQP